MCRCQMPVPCSMNLASRDSYSPVLNLELGRVQVDTGHIMPQPVIYRCLEKLTKISHWKCLFYLALEISSFVREWWMPQFFFKSFIGKMNDGEDWELFRLLSHILGDTINQTQLGRIPDMLDHLLSIHMVSQEPESWAEVGCQKKLQLQL